MNEYLIKAAEYIDQYGWCQKTFQDEWGRACMVGAIEKVTPKEHRQETYMRAINFIDNHFDSLSITFVNDTILKTGEEASKLLREAAEWVPNDNS